MTRIKVETGKENSDIDVEFKVRSSRVKLTTLLSEIRRLTENLQVDGVEVSLVEQTVVQHSIYGKTLITVTSKFQSQN